MGKCEIKSAMIMKLTEKENWPIGMKERLTAEELKNWPLQKEFYI